MNQLPKRNARELAIALCERAMFLTGLKWERPATVAMMLEVADMIERLAGLVVAQQAPLMSPIPQSMHHEACCCCAECKTHA